MDIYKNLSGQAGVTHYSIENDSIKIRFKNSNSIYTFNHIKPGSFHTNKMKELALSGIGLSSYINQEVKKDYYSVVQ